jgi:hypothetical protein
MKRTHLHLLFAGLTMFLSLGCGFLYAAAPPATSAPVALPTQAEGQGEPAPLPTPVGEEPLPPTAAPVDILAQMQQIDAALRQQISGSIAYNQPESMELEEPAAIQLLLSPSLTEEQLGTQVTEPGEVQTAVIQITPRMKAVLLSPLEEAFTIQPLQQDVQLVSASEPTRWTWSVTPRQAGTQRLVLVLSRLVLYEGQEYWREVETYKADIQVNVPFTRRIQSIDWKWLIGILVALASLPFLQKWIARRKK